MEPKVSLMKEKGFPCLDERDETPRGSFEDEWAVPGRVYKNDDSSERTRQTQSPVVRGKRRHNYRTSTPTRRHRDRTTT